MGVFRIAGLIHSVILAAAVMPSLGQFPVSISGTITDSAGAPIAAASIVLETSGLTATSGADGKFTVTRGTSAINARPQTHQAAIHGGSLFLSVPEKSSVTITAFGAEGKALGSVERNVDAGSQRLPLPQAGSGARFYVVQSGTAEFVVNAVSMEGASSGPSNGAHSPSRTGSRSGPHAQAQSAPAPLAKTAAEAFFDVITVTKTGYLKSYLTVAVSEMANADIKMLKTTSPKFSFFVTSMKAMLELSGNPQGFGGDYRFGETGPGAGLRGADKLCAAIAERSMKSSSNKGWRAFLSVTADAAGKQVNAIDRVGPGPWYDRTGRLLATTKADLLAVRPQNGDPTIQNDLPNEDGIPNHRPDPSKPADDNHHTITGSNASGALQSATATCKDWTTSEGTTANGKPAHGYSWPRSLGGGGGGGTAPGSNWMASGSAFGCGRGVQIVETGPGDSKILTIGEGGGYGGFYCFALNP